MVFRLYAPCFCGFFILFFSFLCFFFCFRCRDRFRTLIGSISLKPPTPANARDQRWAQFSSPTLPPPLPTRCIPRYYGASTIYPGPTVFFFFFHVTGCLVPVCLSVRLSVSASLFSLQFCFSWFRFSSSLFPPTECICTKCRGSAHNIAFGLFSPYYFCISYIDQKGSFLPPFEYNFLAFPLLNDRTLYPTCLLFSHIAHI